MGTVRHPFLQPSDQLYQRVGTAAPASFRIAGTNHPNEGLAFADGADQATFGKLIADNYGSGNWTVDFYWTGVTSTATNSVVWGFAMNAITPESDSTDVETDSLATEQTVTDAHLGTTAKRIMKASLTVSNLDSVAAGDIVHFRVRRLGTNGSDNYADTARLVGLEISYSDT